MENGLHKGHPCLSAKNGNVLTTGICNEYMGSKRFT